MTMNVQRLELVRYLAMEKGASVLSTNRFGGTPLHYSIQCREVEITRTLLDAYLLHNHHPVVNVSSSSATSATGTSGSRDIIERSDEVTDSPASSLGGDTPPSNFTLLFSSSSTSSPSTSPSALPSQP